MLFLDSSNPGLVEELWQWGVLSGVTTNPLIISREMLGADLEKTIKAILAVSSGSVSVELTSTGVDAMVKEARVYAGWEPRICIKVPVNETGLVVIRRLRHAGINTNATCIMTPTQALLAAKAGALYVSLFYGRIKDMDEDAKEVVWETKEMLRRHGESNAKIIAGSIRQPADVREAFDGGADIVTVPPAILRKMVHHPRTEETIQEFSAAWEKHLACKP